MIINKERGRKFIIVRFLAVTILFIFGIGWAISNEEIQINKAVSGEDWDFTIISIQNTGKQKWREATELGQTAYKEIKGKNLSYWRLKIKAKYKNLTKKWEGFNSNWVDVVYTTRESIRENSETRAGVIEKRSPFDIGRYEEEAIFGSVTEKPEKLEIDFSKDNPITSRQPAPVEMEILFIAPNNKEEITSMYVKFLDYPKVQVIPQK